MPLLTDVVALRYGALTVEKLMLAGQEIWSAEGGGPLMSLTAGTLLSAETIHGD